MYIAPEIQSVDDYLNSIPLPLKKEAIGDLLDIVYETMRGISQDLQSPIEMPELRICKTTAIQAECNHYSLQLTEGLIELCLTTYYPPIHYFIPELTDQYFDYYLPGKMALAWIVAHEWMHVVRCHNAVVKALQGVVDSPAELMEHDADLCAAASIFRTIQRSCYYSGDPSIARKISLYCIYWPLRKVGIERHDEAHAPMPLRLYHVMSKLAHLADVFGEVPAIYDRFDSTSAHFTDLATLIISFDRSPLAETGHYDLALEIWKILQSRIFMKFYIEWAKVCKTVEEISNTRADINKHKPEGYIDPEYDEHYNLVSPGSIKEFLKK